MPIYEFACANCGTTFEKRVSFSDVTAPPCDNCHSENVERQLSAPAIHFKGSGWYITDSKKSKNGDSKQSTKTTDGESSKPDDASSSEKSETTASSEKSSAAESSSKSDSSSTTEKSAAKE